MDSVTGFQAKLEVTDGASDASVKFDGVVTLTLPSEEVGEYEETELDQKDGSDPDPVKRFAPDGHVELGMLKCELKYSASNHARLRALVGKKGKTWKLTPPDEDGAGTTSPLTASGLGFLKAIEEIVFEGKTPVRIKFTVRPQKKWAFTLPS